MPVVTQKPSTKESLLLAGIHVLETEGVAGFSVRKTTALCGVSAAALYKHFQDKEDLISGIITYIGEQWMARARAVVDTLPAADARSRLIAVSMAYITFLMDNPHFRSIMMMKDARLPDAILRRKAGISILTSGLIDEYCQGVGMSPQRRAVKTFVVRSLIYGAALMFDNGEIEYTPGHVEQVRQAIEREFDLA